MLEKNISVPGLTKVVSEENEYKYGFAELLGMRDTQQDVITSYHFDKEQFSLPANALAHRLWTAFKELNATRINSYVNGSTVSSTLFDGKDSLITATLGDSVSFAVVYNSDNSIQSVYRLNAVVHHPEEEPVRVRRAGGVVIDERLALASGSNLAVSRALGDFNYRNFGLCDDPQINITSLAELTQGDKTRRVQIITTCDGFTDAAPVQSKKGHEALLKAVLEQAQGLGLSEGKLAEFLADYAERETADYADNISIIVQTVEPEKPFFQAVYDGHGVDAEVSIAAANNLVPLFLEQCSLTQEDYARQPLSVDNNFVIYHRDNPDVEFYEPRAAKEKNLRVGQLRQPGGVYEAITKLKDAREELIALDKFLGFLENLNTQYVDLVVDKKEVLEYLHNLFDEKPKFQVNHVNAIQDRYSILPCRFAELRADVRYLQQVAGLKKNMGDLIDIYDRVIGAKISPQHAKREVPVLQSRTGLFSPPTSPRSPRSPRSSGSSPSLLRTGGTGLDQKTVSPPPTPESSPFLSRRTRSNLGKPTPSPSMGTLEEGEEEGKEDNNCSPI